jgi:hypothetical protein
LSSGYFELSSGGIQNNPKSFWPSEGANSAAGAPNCVSLMGYKDKEKFQTACTYILEQQATRRSSQTNQPSIQLSARSSRAEILQTLEELGGLKSRGVITEEDFENKKRDLLAKL